MSQSKLTAVESEALHFERLLEALRRFREAAARRDWDVGYLQEAVKNCMALAFYRNDQRWSAVGAALDELAKKVPDMMTLTSSITTQIDGMIEAVTKLKNRRLN